MDIRIAKIESTETKTQPIAANIRPTDGVKVHMEKPKVLIIDDEPEFCEVLADLLKDQFLCKTVSNPQEAIDIVQKETFDAILSDVNMPGIKGTQLVEHLRTIKSLSLTPIIMVTGLDTVETRVECFHRGADDFIAKPFSPNEIVARIESKIRRSKDMRKSSESTKKLGDLELNLINHTLSIANVDVSIGEIEFRILHCLLNSNGQLVSRDELNQFIWQGDLPSERAMDPHITSLRKKLKSDRVELRTIYGRGYSLVER
jgi:DNA-binding response OmpR family regulator